MVWYVTVTSGHTCGFLLNGWWDYGLCRWGLLLWASRRRCEIKTILQWDSLHHTWHRTSFCLVGRRGQFGRLKHIENKMVFLKELSWRRFCDTSKKVHYMCLARLCLSLPQTPRRLQTWTPKSRIGPEGNGAHKSFSVISKEISSVFKYSTRTIINFTCVGAVCIVRLWLSGCGTLFVMMMVMMMVVLFLVLNNNFTFQIRWWWQFHIWL